MRNPIASISDRVGKVTTEDDGQGLAEYALILAFVALLTIASLQFLGGAAAQVLSTAGNSL